VESSILSIDSFGAFDTTRIFYREVKNYRDMNALEAKLVNELKTEYSLNRVGGGLNNEDDSALRNVQLWAQTHNRDLE